MTPENRDPTALTETFEWQSSTHSFSVKWCSLGPPDAPPLVFIHGTPWSSRVWTPYALSLARHFRVYLSDNPGFGESPLERPLPGTDAERGEFPDATSRYDADLARQSGAFAALLHHWRETHGWGEEQAAAAAPHVVAHDHGGLVALRAHLLHGCAFASLCLVDVVAVGPFGQPLFAAVAADPDRIAQLPDVAVEGILETYIRDAAHTELPREVVDALKAPWLREGGKAGFIRQLCQASYRNTDAVEHRYGEVGRIMPVKIVWGKEDKWIPAETAHRLGEALGAQEVVLVEDAGHLIMYDQPARLGVELGTWLMTISGTNKA